MAWICQYQKEGESEWHNMPFNYNNRSGHDEHYTIRCTDNIHTPLTKQVTVTSCNGCVFSATSVAEGAEVIWKDYDSLTIIGTSYITNGVATYTDMNRQQVKASISSNDYVFDTTETKEISCNSSVEFVPKTIYHAYVDITFMGGEFATYAFSTLQFRAVIKDKSDNNRTIWSFTSGLTNPDTCNCDTSLCPFDVVNNRRNVRFVISEEVQLPDNTKPLTNYELEILLDRNVGIDLAGVNQSNYPGAVSNCSATLACPIASGYWQVDTNNRIYSTLDKVNGSGTTIKLKECNRSKKGDSDNEENTEEIKEESSEQR